MKRDNLPWGAAEAASLLWAADGSPHSARFGDIYYSREDGAGESRYVFLEGNRLAERPQPHRNESKREQ